MYIFFRFFSFVDYYKICHTVGPRYLFVLYSINLSVNSIFPVYTTAIRFLDWGCTTSKSRAEISFIFFIIYSSVCRRLLVLYASHFLSSVLSSSLLFSESKLKSFRLLNPLPPTAPQFPWLLRWTGEEGEVRWAYNWVMGTRCENI